MKRLEQWIIQEVEKEYGVPAELFYKRDNKIARMVAVSLLRQHTFLTIDNVSELLNLKKEMVYRAQFYDINSRAKTVLEKALEGCWGI